MKLEDQRPKTEEGNTFNFRLRSSNFLLFIPSLIWLITIAVLSGYPGNKIPEALFLNFDKLVHLGVYFLLSLILCYGFHKKNATDSTSLKTSVLIILFGIFYGGFMEILQEYVFINRSGNWYDFFANAVGAILGVVFYPIIIKSLSIKK